MTTVFRLDTAPAGPMASSARLTRCWGSGGGGGIVAQEPTKRDNNAADKMRFMTFPPSKTNRNPAPVRKA